MSNVKERSMNKLTIFVVVLNCVVNMLLGDISKPIHFMVFGVLTSISVLFVKDVILKDLEKNKKNKALIATCLIQLPFAIVFTIFAEYNKDHNSLLFSIIIDAVGK